MNFETILNDSVNFTRDTLPGNPARWLFLFLLGLPGGLLPFAFGISDIHARTPIHWELIHWDQVAVLGILLILASLILSGYIVRIYRGSATPPSFDKISSLFFDGIKLCVVWLIWMLPAIILMVAAILVLVIAIPTGSHTSPRLALLGLMLILLLAAFILMLIALVLGTVGAIRFARTGYISEGVNYREILAWIGRIGWWDFIIAGIVLMVIGLLFSLVSTALGLVPFIGWVLDLIIAPVITVLGARFISLVYDTGLPPVVPVT